MKPTDVLLEDHRRIHALLDRCTQATGEARGQTVRAAGAELRRHWRLEEEVVYPVLSRLRDETARGAVREALEQHHRLDGLLAELEAVEPDDARFEARLMALRSAFEGHVAHEEKAVFAGALDRLASPRLQKLAGQIRSRRR